MSRETVQQRTERFVRAYRLQIPLSIVSIFTILILVNYFTGGQYYYLSRSSQEITLWGTVIGTIVGLYGTIYLWLLHGTRLVRRRESHPKLLFGSIVFFISFIGVFMLGITYSWTGNFNTIYVGLTSLLGTGVMTLKWSGHMYAVYSQLSRIRSYESAVFFIAWFTSVCNGLTVMTYLIPQVSIAAEWISVVPNVAVMRGSLLASGLGALILGSRTIVQKEPGVIEVEA